MFKNQYSAVIVGRTGSVRISSKIFQIINGEALILRKVRQCMESKYIDKVYVGTDAEELQEEVEKLGAVFCRMPDEYCQGRDSSGMIKNVLSFFESENVVWAHPTNPLVEAIHYDKAIEQYQDAQEKGYVGLFSVTENKGHFWHDHLSPINFGILNATHKVAAELPPVYEQNGAIFIRPHEAMKKDGLFIAGASVMHTMDVKVGWDIDEPWQLEVARMLACQADNY